MKEIAISLRCLQLYAHNAHNLVSRMVFFQDHEFLGEVYSAAESNYDSVIERIIGLGQEELDLSQLQVLACTKMTKLPMQVSENLTFMQVILQLEKEISGLIEQKVKSGSCSVGTEQLLGDIADKSEVRQYKLKQRIKK